MLNESVARRYAAAFFAIAQERNELGRLEHELELVVGTLKSDPQLVRLFTHKLISPSDKKAMLKELFAGQVSPITMNFLNLLIDKKREGHLENILKQFVEMANEARNITDASVVSAIELSYEDQKDLQERLSKLTGKNIRLKTSVDPKLIGGIVIRVGDRVLDGSLIKRLHVLKNNLMKAQLKSV
ncbi:MAG: F0F1 ATP synthase subunit delta [Firmicutes bacterium]|nr:F0F1 ATP synthase subunit delta [Bacillota bacterium]